jgi:hypothetical protein
MLGCDLAPCRCHDAVVEVRVDLDGGDGGGDDGGGDNGGCLLVVTFGGG